MILRHSLKRQPRNHELLLLLLQAAGERGCAAAVRAVPRNILRFLLSGELRRTGGPHLLPRLSHGQGKQGVLCTLCWTLEPPGYKDLLCMCVNAHLCATNMYFRTVSGGITNVATLSSECMCNASWDVGMAVFVVSIPCVCCCKRNALHAVMPTSHAAIDKPKAESLHPRRRGLQYPTPATTPASGSRHACWVTTQCVPSPHAGVIRQARPALGHAAAPTLPHSPQLAHARGSTGAYAFQKPRAGHTVFILVPAVPFRTLAPADLRLSGTQSVPAGGAVRQPFPLPLDLRHSSKGRLPNARIEHTILAGGAQAESRFSGLHCAPCQHRQQSSSNSQPTFLSSASEPEYPADATSYTYSPTSFS